MSMAALDIIDALSFMVVPFRQASGGGGDFWALLWHQRSACAAALHGGRSQLHDQVFWKNRVPCTNPCATAWMDAQAHRNAGWPNKSSVINFIILGCTLHGSGRPHNIPAPSASSIMAQHTISTDQTVDAWRHCTMPTTANLQQYARVPLDQSHSHYPSSLSVQEERDECQPPESLGAASQWKQLTSNTHSRPSHARNCTVLNVTASYLLNS